MLKQRIITALILAPLALYAILFLPIFWFEIAIAGVVGIGAYEWANMSGVCERPKKLIYFKLPYGVQPSFLVDISRFFEKKMKVINCFSSQLHNPKSKQPKTYLSVPEFLPSLRALNQYYGSLINSTYAEAFFSKEAIAVEDPLEFFVT